MRIIRKSYDKVVSGRKPTAKTPRRRAALLGAATLTALALVVPAGAVQAATWNGYGNQFSNRMAGGDTVTYWYHSSAFSNYYNTAFDHSLLSWSQPRVNGATADSGAARCTPYNNFWHEYTSNISAATVEYYALATTGYYSGVNGYAAFYVNGRPNEIAVDPDASAYGWGQVVLNTTVMNSRPLLTGVGSKRTVASHELGHVLGLAHYQASGTVMAQQDFRTVIGPTCQDNNSLRQRW